MCNKAIFLTLLITVIGVQFANCLTCYTCHNAHECQNPHPKNCDNMFSNLTSRELDHHYEGVTNLTSTKFECLALKYTYPLNKTVAYELRGCLHPEVNPCKLHLKPQFAHWPTPSCTVCSKDNCNKSPAGKMSSSAFAVVGTVLAVILAKIY